MALNSSLLEICEYDSSVRLAINVNYVMFGVSFGSSLCSLLEFKMVISHRKFEPHYL